MQLMQLNKTEQQILSKIKNSVRGVIAINYDLGNQSPGHKRSSFGVRQIKAARKLVQKGLVVDLGDNTFARK